MLQTTMMAISEGSEEEKEMFGAVTWIMSNVNG
jgi:hypothetical protein